MNHIAGKFQLHPMISAPSTTESCYPHRQRWLVRVALVLAGMPIASLSAQTTFTWQQIKDKFATSNPTLKAAQLGIDESRAAEITAYLRPNPDFTLSADGMAQPIDGLNRQDKIFRCRDRRENYNNSRYCSSATRTNCARVRTLVLAKSCWRVFFTVLSETSTRVAISLFASP